MKTDGSTFLYIPVEGSNQKWINLNHVVEITTEGGLSIHDMTVIVRLITGETVEIVGLARKKMLFDWLSEREVGEKKASE